MTERGKNMIALNVNEMQHNRTNVCYILYMNSIKEVINYIVSYTDTPTDNDICLMLLYYNYIKFRDYNEPGIMINIIAMNQRYRYDYFPENVTISAVLQNLIKDPIIIDNLSAIDKNILDEVIKQWRMGSEPFEELIATVLHTKTKVRKNIIDLPKVLFFACKNKKEYSVLLSRLHKIIDDYGR